jgi:hypothetical protein
VATRFIPVANAAQARAAIPDSLHGRLHLELLRVTPGLNTNGVQLPQHLVGDFLGDGSVTMYEEYYGGATLATLRGDVLETFARPAVLAGSWDTVVMAPRVALLPRPAGDLVLRVEGATSTLDAISLPDGRPVWRFPVPGGGGIPRGQLGTLADAAGHVVVWYADADSGTLTFLDADGLPLGEDVFLTGTRFFPGDFDGDGVEDLLALHPRHESRLFDAAGAVTLRIRLALPDGLAPISAWPARGADGTPQIRLDFNKFSPLFHTLDGRLAEAPADEPAVPDWRPFLQQGDLLPLGDGRHLMVTNTQLTLLGPDGRTQDVLNGEDMAFLPVGRDGRGRPLIAVFAEGLFLAAVTAE